MEKVLKAELCFKFVLGIMRDPCSFAISLIYKSLQTRRNRLDLPPTKSKGFFQLGSGQVRSWVLETIACLFGPSSLTFSAKSAILELKGGEDLIFSLCMMFKKVISFICEKIYFGDRVPDWLLNEPLPISVCS